MTQYPKASQILEILKNTDFEWHSNTVSASDLGLRFGEQKTPERLFIEIFDADFDEFVQTFPTYFRRFLDMGDEVFLIQCELDFDIDNPIFIKRWNV